MKTSILLTLCLLFPGLTAAAEANLAGLLEALSQTREQHARFVETRYLAILDRPIEAHGEVHYRAPDFFEKHTRAPQEEILQLHGERIAVEQNGQRWHSTLAQTPQVAAWIGALPALLRGDLATLEKSYALTFAPRAQSAWTLTLLPHDDSVNAPVQRIEIQGREHFINRVKYVAGDGDLIVMQLEPLND